MKTFDSGLSTHYGLSTTTIAVFLEVERRDGVFVRATSADQDVVVDGDTYVSAKGLDSTSLSVSSGAAVDAMQMTIFPDDDIPEVDLIAGLWDFAKFRLFEANYLSPGDGINVLRRGWLGNVDAAREGYTVELRSLKQAWQQPVGAVTSKTCRARVGDEKCTVDLAPWTRTGTVTTVGPFSEIPAITLTGAITTLMLADPDVPGVYSASYFDTDLVQPNGTFARGTFTFTSGANAGDSRQVLWYTDSLFMMVNPFDEVPEVGDTFTATSQPISFGTARQSFIDESIVEVDDFFGEGSVRWTSGANVGYAQKVRAFVAGVFSLALATPLPISVGDEFEAIAGCRKRLLEDCRNKFANVLNFQGEPHVPGADLLMADPDIGGGE